MDCSYPILIRNPKTKELQRVPCGRCVPCMERRQKDWAFRLQQELKYTQGRSVFVTLTYDDEHLPFSESGEPTLVKRDFQLFMKRFRKQFSDYTLRYFACGEYGFHPQTGVVARPHYHAIIFGLPNDTNKIDSILHDCWKNGFITFDGVTRGRCFYVAKYCIKPNNRVNDFDKIERPFALMSTRPPIGSKYLDVASDYHRKSQSFFCVDSKSQKVALPRYYKERIFNDLERKWYARQCEIKASIRENKSVLPFLRKGYDSEESYLLSLRRQRKDRDALERITYKRLYEKKEL